MFASWLAKLDRSSKIYEQRHFAESTLRVRYEALGYHVGSPGGLRYFFIQHLIVVPRDSLRPPGQSHTFSRSLKPRLHNAETRPLPRQARELLVHRPFWDDILGTRLSRSAAWQHQR